MIQQHEITNGICIHCGAWEPMKERTCTSRPSAEEIPGAMPEPVERRYAVYDADTISGRLAELRAERDAAMNQPAPETPAAVATSFENTMMMSDDMMSFGFFMVAAL